NQCDEDKGVGETGLAVNLDFRDAIKRDGLETVKAKYGNLFDMYERITDEDPYQVPMRIYPAIHYTMGGLWVDYNLMSTVEGLFILGEANFSDHGANRLGASALMQGLADGYFVIPYTLGNYFASNKFEAITTDDEAFVEAEKISNQLTDKLLAIKGKLTVDHFHKRLGEVMWEYVGMARNEAGLKKALKEIPKIREEFWQNVRIPGSGEELNIELEKACRVADFLELGELMARDALERVESCGGHFRDESQTDENEALRDDKKFAHVAAWEYKGEGKKPTKHLEELKFEYVPLSQRSYK
ncbi:MAG: FAD-binding protein, partial [Bdellovibrionales bacterium]|nr:FAD-binding protein [Bdellovibrionales bacterium]